VLFRSNTSLGRRVHFAQTRQKGPIFSCRAPGSSRYAAAANFGLLAGELVPVAAQKGRSRLDELRRIRAEDGAVSAVRHHPQRRTRNGGS